MMRFAAFLLVLIALIGGYGYATLRSFNHFETIERSFAGKCAPVAGIAGPEDLQIDAVTGRAFISSLDRRKEGARGAIHIFDVDDPLSDSAWRDRTGGVPADFQPLGLYFFRQGEIQRLFVVNQANNGVELFDVASDGALTHMETFTERRLTSPNDVVAVGPRAFYVTNDVRSGRDGMLASLHFIMRSASGAVFYMDGSVWRVALEGLHFANGVNISPDGLTLYVAETAANAINFYDRDADNGRLELLKSIKLAASPDNINVDEIGAVWIGALPKPLLVPRHGRNPGIAAPSEIIRISSVGGAPEVIYRDDGGEISASTSAARIGSTLLIGSLFEKKFLICNLSSEQG